MTLLGSHNAAVGQFCQAGGGGGYGFYQRRPDENGVEWPGFSPFAIENRNGQVDLETVKLAAEGIALDGDVHQTQRGLVAVDIPGHEDRPGTGAPHGMVFAQTP